MLDPLEREILKALGDGKSANLWQVAMYAECYRMDDARQALRELEGREMIEMRNYRYRITANGRLAISQ